MTSKEYLRQAVRLDQRINSDLEELARLREMIMNLPSSAPRDRVRGSADGQAAFTRGVERVMEAEARINEEVDRLVDLREEIREVISAVKDPDERIVLRERYILGRTWEQIGTDMHADERTVRRWHTKALQHVRVPENATVV